MATDPKTITKLSNVIGAPITDYVLRQLAIRAYRSSTGAVSQFGIRTGQEVLYLANKTAWARLVSSVDFDLPDDRNSTKEDQLTAAANVLGIEGSGVFKTTDSFAKNWILEAGTSTQSGNGITLRRGLGPNGAYGLGGTEELGYRPMPGLTSINIETAGRLGSLRIATVNFHVWNMDQLNTIEALYFRLGYSMLLEWGHTQYFSNYGVDLKTPNQEGVFVSKEIYGIGDPFVAGLRKEAIQEAIERKRFETSGNYDGMFGLVSNFNWSYNQDGGYDCSVKIVGMGAIIDSVRINQVYTLPPVLEKRYKIAADAINEYQRRLAYEEAQKNKPKEGGGGGTSGTSGGEIKLLDPPKDPAGLRNVMATYDSGPTDRIAFDKKYGVIAILDYAASNNYKDYFAQFTTPGPGPDVKGAVFTAASKKYTGLYLDRRGPNNSAFIYLNTQQPVDVQLSKTALDGFANSAEGKDYSSENPFYKPFDTLTALAEYAKRKTTERGDKDYAYRNTLTKIFYVFTRHVVNYRRGDSDFVPRGGRVEIDDLLSPPDKSHLLWGTKTSRTYYASDVASLAGSKEVKITFDIEFPSGIQDFKPSRREFLKGVDDWVEQGALAKINGVTFTKDSGEIEIRGEFTVIVYSGYQTPTGGTFLDYTALDSLNKQSNTYPGLIRSPYDANQGVIPYSIKVLFTSNDTGIIAGLSPAPPPAQNTTPPAGGTVNSGPDPAVQQVLTDNQVDSSAGFESALHAMLTTVQVISQSESIKPTKTTLKTYRNKKNEIKIVTVDLTSITAAFYQGNALDGVFEFAGKEVTPEAFIRDYRKSFNLKLYGAKGFSSELMSNPEKFNDIPYVGGNSEKSKFANLCKSMVVKYRQENPEVGDMQFAGQYQVYIPLGFLLAFIDNMCLFYDSKAKINTGTAPAAGEEKRPYVYIDFNPETNFCLTSPQQFSIDPNVCLVPANLDKDQYLEIFPENLKPSNPFNPQKESTVTQAIDEAGLGFKSTDSTYRGKTMNIMLCTQYLLSTLRNFATGDREHAVALQPFLDRVMSDVNKALGNVNLFRIAYRDDTNTVQIQDDQYVPSLNGEITAINREAFINNLKTNAVLAGELPLFASQIKGADGKNLAIPSLGIAREMQFKTVMSTRMASKVAISAQSSTGSVNGSDHSELSWLNQNYKDRYKPYVEDANRTQGTSAQAGKTTKPNQKGQQSQSNSSSNKEAANKFNEHVKTVYSSLAISKDALDPSKNYYIERMSKVKSENLITSAAPFIPAEIEITMDGIGGIIMGNAFTIPPQRLPRTYLASDGYPRVGFIISGLTHKIENNEWTTAVKGQMVRLRQYSGLNTAVATATGEQSGLVGGGSGGGSDEPATPLPTIGSGPYLQNAIYVKDYMKNKGLSKEVVAGIMGNIQAESGFDPSQKFLDENGRYSFGLIQWNEAYTPMSSVGNTAQSQIEALFNVNATPSSDAFINRFIPAAKADPSRSAEYYAYLFANKVERCVGCIGSYAEYKQGGTGRSGNHYSSFKRSRYAADFLNRFNTPGDPLAW